MPLAHQWLRQAGATRGFEDFDIVVQPVGDEGLLVESIHHDAVVNNLVPNDVDA